MTTVPVMLRLLDVAWYALVFWRWARRRSPVLATAGLAGLVLVIWLFGLFSTATTVAAFVLGVLPLAALLVRWRSNRRPFRRPPVDD